METTLARYLDGELDAHEADAFLQALQDDPDLEARLSAYERMLAASRSLPSAPAPAGFADAVMERVRRGADLPRRSHRAGAPTGPRRALLAAAAIVLFVGGFAAARWTAPEAAAPLPGAPRVQPLSFGSSGGDGPLMLVRLVHVPSGPEVEEVSVAGSFTSWDPARVPMRRQDGVFQAALLLPPGSYEYMFVEDGERWVTDPAATVTRDDGFGQRNAVLDLGV